MMSLADMVIVSLAKWGVDAWHLQSQWYEEASRMQLG